MNIIPTLKKVSETGGSLRARDIILRDDAGELHLAAVFQECVEEILGPRQNTRLERSQIGVRLKKLAAADSGEFLGSLEGYRLSVETTGVTIESASARGFVYGIHTLLFISTASAGGDIEIPCCRIEDWPDFTMRGMQDDPMRGQVSTVENYKRLIRELSRLKYNVLTFHTEDMFRFDRHPEIGKAHGALTKSQWRELVEYGRCYGLDLFLTFQTFSHVGRVTSMPLYNRYSDLPGEAAHYSPAVSEVYEFFDELFGEIHEVFGGDTIHIGCDEVDLRPEGLRSSPMVRDLGTASVYVGHVTKVAERARKYWGRVLFFAEFADNRLTPPSRGSVADIYALRDAGLSFVNWNYYDHRWEDYFHYLNTLNRCGVEQIISPGVWTWRQLFPDYFETLKTLPVFTDIAFREGVKESITCAWNDTTDCFRELHHLNYAIAAEHQWNAGLSRDEPAAFVRRWTLQFFGVFLRELADAHLWLGGLNRLVYEAARHDHRFPREYNWRPIVAHAVFWNYPVPGSGTEGDARASAEMLEWARDLNSGVRSVASKTTRNRSVIDLVCYELSRAEWMFDSVVFSVKADTDHALRLADELRRLKDDYVRLWNATNIRQGRQRVEVRFDKLIGLYEKEAQGLTPWNGVWRPALRMQTGPHPL